MDELEDDDFINDEEDIVESRPEDHRGSRGHRDHTETETPHEKPQEEVTAHQRPKKLKASTLSAPKAKAVRFRM